MIDPERRPGTPGDPASGGPRVAADTTDTDLPTKHTQGGLAMKDKTRRRIRPQRRRARTTALALQTGLIAMLLPLAAGLSAQNTLRWDAAGTEGRIVSFVHNELSGGLSELEVNLPLSKSLREVT